MPWISFKGLSLFGSLVFLCPFSDSPTRACLFSFLFARIPAEVFCQPDTRSALWKKRALLDNERITFLGWCHDGAIVCFMVLPGLKLVHVRIWMSPLSNAGLGLLRVLAYNLDGIWDILSFLASVWAQYSYFFCFFYFSIHDGQTISYLPASMPCFLSEACGSWKCYQKGFDVLTFLFISTSSLSLPAFVVFAPFLSPNCTARSLLLVSFYPLFFSRFV